MIKTFKQFLEDRQMMMFLSEEGKNMEIAEDIFNRFSNIISSSNDYQDAVKKLEKEGVTANFDVNRYPMLGHRWAESFYEAIAIGGNKRNRKENYELDKKLNNLSSKVVSLGFEIADSPESSFYFFNIPGYKEEKKRNMRGKIHVKIPPEKPEYILDLVQIIKSNLSFVRQFKFSASWSSFESRRDNFIIYLSMKGEENLNFFREQISSLGLQTDVGEDFTGNSGGGLSQTQLVSLRLAVMLVSKNGSPPSPNYEAKQFKITQREFLLSDPIGSRYLKDSNPTPEKNKPISSGEYVPKTLVIQTKSKPLQSNINIEVGKDLLKHFLGDESKYFSQKQFKINKSTNGWYLIPDLSAHNKTIINGSIVDRATRININDQIGIIGNSGNRLVPLRVTSV